MKILNPWPKKSLLTLFQVSPIRLESFWSRFWAHLWKFQLPSADSLSMAWKVFISQIWLGSPWSRFWVNIWKFQLPPTDSEYTLRSSNFRQYFRNPWAKKVPIAQIPKSNQSGSGIFGPDSESIIGSFIFPLQILVHLQKFQLAPEDS